MSSVRPFVAGSFAVFISIELAVGNAFGATIGHFPNMAPGASLPSGEQCATWVKSSPAAPEVRPENTAANMTTPTPDELAALHVRPLTASPSATSDFARVDGNFTGTTDQILRWAACKWGIDEDVFRAQAWEESKWKQSAAGDEKTDPNLCHAGAWNGWNGTSCQQSYGILQVKVFDYNTWPEARHSTALNADFHAAEHRRCMNGDINYLRERTPLSPYPNYPTSDTELATWGCIGNWYSGGWYDAAAVDYINHVKQSLAAQPWTHLR